MAAYIVFTRLRTRNPEEVKRYVEQAPKSLVGHNVKFLAQFGRYEVREGGGARASQSRSFPASPRPSPGTTAHRTKAPANTASRGKITASLSWMERVPKKPAI